MALQTNKYYNVSYPGSCFKREIGEANDSAAAQVQLTDQQTNNGQRMYTYEKAVGALNLGGVKSDGKLYLASAQANGGGLRLAARFLFHNEGPAGDRVDQIYEPRTIILQTAVSGAVAGGIAYLDDTTTNRGGVTATAPVGTGKLVQIVGHFESDTIVRIDINPQFTIL